jgi:hypothetical protein
MHREGHFISLAIFGLHIDEAKMGVRIKLNLGSLRPQGLCLFSPQRNAPAKVLESSSSLPSGILPLPFCPSFALTTAATFLLWTHLGTLLSAIRSKTGRGTLAYRSSPKINQNESNYPSAGSQNSLVFFIELKKRPGAVACSGLV